MRRLIVASLASLRLEISIPSNSIRPDVGLSNPPKRKRRLVFPDPDGPYTARSLPLGTFRFTSSNATVFPDSFQYVLFNDSVFRIASSSKPENLLRGYTCDFQSRIDGCKERDRKGEQGSVDE